MCKTAFDRNRRYRDRPKQKPEEVLRLRDVGLGEQSMQEFRIEGHALRRENRFSVLSWGTILLLTAATVLLFVLGVTGHLSANSNLRWLFVFTVLGAVIGASILACLEALHYAKRQMVFVLDDNEIVRKRQGYPDVKIAFSEIETLSEELRWLIIYSSEPRRKIAVPTNVQGYEVIRAEIAKHHALSPPAKFPLESVAKGAALTILSILSWAAVLWLRDPRAVIIAGVAGLTLLGIGSYRLWILLRRAQKRLLALVCLGFTWIAAVLLIYARAVRL